jgi:glycosyltransferase involved in cell wall biosynthesis
MSIVTDARDLARIMGEAQLVVSSQRVDTAVVGRFVLEALSCGTPVVVMARPVDPPLGDCESLLTTENYGSLRSTVREFYRNWGAGGYDEERLSSQARRCIVENYSFESRLRRYERMFEDVVRTWP